MLLNNVFFENIADYRQGYRALALYIKKKKENARQALTLPYRGAVKSLHKSTYLKRVGPQTTSGTPTDHKNKGPEYPI